MEPVRAIAHLSGFPLRYRRPRRRRLDIAREIGSGFSHCIFFGSVGEHALAITNVREDSLSVSLSRTRARAHVTAAH